jgi:hypothetical protein
MGRNEVDSLNEFYHWWLKNRFPSKNIKANPFEFFCADEFLKGYLLDDTEVLSGLVGNGDGGVDAFYFFVNHVLADDNTPVDRRSENNVDVVIMQVKENEGFSPTAIEKLTRFSHDLLDFSRSESEYRHRYNSTLTRLMAIFKSKMKGMADAKIRVEYYYATRRDEPPDENALRAERELRKVPLQYFRHAEVKPLHYAGALELYDQTLVRPPTQKSLRFVKSIDTDEGWVGWVTLKTFYEFLKDEKQPNKLNELIFSDNVRGYFQNTAINRAITATLALKTAPEFWMLNNGITILTPKASLSGDLTIRDPQIVNGLQTSRRIFDYFASLLSVPATESRRILIRVIQTNDPEIRDEIIRATNNQNKMPAEALISTSRLHKQLESHFAGKGLFYDRRKGHFKDQGKDIGKIVSILFLVQAVVAIMLKKPNDARGRPRDYVNKDTKRWQVFGFDDYRTPEQKELLTKYKPFDLDIYLRCVNILRRVDEFLEQRVEDNEERRNVRFYVVRYASCAVTKNAYCPPVLLLKANIESITDSVLEAGLRAVKKIYKKRGEDDDAAKGKEMLAELDGLLVKKFSPPHKNKKATQQ